MGTKRTKWRGRGQQREGRGTRRRTFPCNTYIHQFKKFNSLQTRLHFLKVKKDSLPMAGP